MSYQANQPGTELSMDEQLILAQLANIGIPGQVPTVNPSGTGIIYTTVSGTTPSLQAVTDIGATTTNDITVNSLTETVPTLLKINQTTPQTTVGTFTFPIIRATTGIYDNAGTPLLSIDSGNRKLYKSDGSAIQIDWTGTVNSFAGISFDQSNPVFGYSIYDFSSKAALNAAARYLYASNGTTVMLDWSTANALKLSQLAAGTASAGTAPLQFTSGPKTTIAVAGQLEYFTNRFYIRGTDKLSIGAETPTYQLEITDSNTATGGILVNTSSYTNIPNPGSISNSAIFNARGFGFAVDGYTLGATFQPTLGIGLAGNRGPMLGIKASATGAAIAIEQGRIGVGTAGPETPIDSIGNIQTRSTSATAYETRTRMTSTYYAGASNYSSGGIEIDGVQAAVGYGLYGATRFYAGANTDATRGWAWKADGLLLTTTLALSTGQMVLNKAGNLGIGTIAPAVRLHVISATEQLRLGYNASNYLSATVDTAGSTTFALTGTTPTFTFSQEVKVSTLTAGRVTFAGTSGLLTDDADMTFATDTLTVTKGDIGFPYGSFSDSTTQTFASVTTAYPITFNTDEVKSLITHSTSTNPSRIYVDVAGSYMITYSACASSPSGNGHINFWLRKNNSDIARTNTTCELNELQQIVITVTYIIPLAKDDYIELIGNSQDTLNVTINATGVQTTPDVPASPSIILTINKISK
jgi:hypothetical protein